MQPSRHTRAMAALHEVFGFAELRSEHQRRAVQAAIAQRDSLVVLPTGGGKSLCYQLPAFSAASGLVAVICPLIALMQNQVRALRQKGIAAEFLCSTLSAAERNRVIADLRSLKPATRLLYLSPEALVGSLIQGTDARRGGVGRGLLENLASAGKLLLVAVDEVGWLVPLRWSALLSHLSLRLTLVWQVDTETDCVNKAAFTRE